ncbi:GIY-YIG nuclease family protein [Aliiroseovarius sp. F47248L]|uniref:GIY-YIG nuclease family protein n=1 Tax=Aliiroseovarius sp. F47248L TaxID=2926420 RepID=UPI001FF1F079|nr:GIY-YIG nuclease family protein [Aliiroseovarius sp. F47248L]MCK0138914.1 GIY-YIG nuclease family protein [Aliiroseovarius sp. F47248L]
MIKTWYGLRMTIYFLTEMRTEFVEPLPIKIGFSMDVRRRTSALQTGNPNRLALMGIIKSRSQEDDRAIERSLHQQFEAQRMLNEWFSLYPAVVIDVLKSHSANGFVTVGQDAFEVVSYDRHGVPEFASPWAWGDVEAQGFCPSCGWAGGWSFNENYGCERCLKCGASGNDYDVCAFDAH